MATYQKTYATRWDVLPDPLLVIIFKRLNIKDVLSCAEVCTNWHDISQDNLLWKHLFKRDFNTKKHKRHRRGEDFTLKYGANNWKEEYIRLTDQIPCVKQQTLKGHVDEVLHVAFSHDGSEVASCSKDHRMIVWRKAANGVFKSHFDVDMGVYEWRHTWAAQYSPSDTKLMVAGVVNDMGGEIAIFSTGEKYLLLCRLLNDPYDVMGCWCTDNYFMCGTMEWFNNGWHNSFDASIWLCSPPTFRNKKQIFNANVKEVSEAGISNMDCDTTDSVSIAAPSVDLRNLLPELESDEKSPNSHNNVVVSWYKKQLLKFRNLQGTIYVRYVQSHSRKEFDRDWVNWTDPEEVSPKNRGSFQDNHEAHDINNGMMFDVLGMDSDVSFEIETDSEGMSKADENSFADQEICVVFICGDKASVPHQIGFHRITSHGLKSTPNLTEPEKVLEMNGHVIGMTISPNKDFLYVNVRSWPDNAVPSYDQAPPIDENIVMKVINLRTLKLENEVFRGHKGFTPTEKAFYLYLDVSDAFVASGSEDSNGYIWEKHYGVLLTKLLHEKCVNCVALNPKDEETCITASDDNTLQVWCSKRKERCKNNDPNSV